VGKAKTYPEAGQLREEIRWTPNPRPQDPTRVELSFARFKRELRATNGGATYFMMPTEVSQARKQGQVDQPLHQWLQLFAKATSSNVSGSTVSTTEYDDYGNVLAAVTTAAEVDLTTTISDVKFNNDPATWLIGQLAHRTECSTAANLKQCRTISRTYYDTGLLQSETVDSEGDATMSLALTYGRDVFGNITSTTADDKLGNHRATSTTYEPSGVFPNKHVNAVGHEVVPAYDAGLGVMTSLVDENQLTTTWKYDGFGRRIRETRPDTTETLRTLTRTKDGGAGQNEWNVKVTTTTEGGEDSAVQYDSLARPIRWWTHGTQTGHDPPPRLMAEVVFDDLGEHVARRSTPMDEAVPPESRQYDEYAYDLTGRVLTHTTPWKATTKYEYEGKKVLVTDPFNKVTTSENDALGRLVAVTDPAGGITAYSYGPFSALWTVTDPGMAVTSTLRDAYGRVRTSIDPDKGTTILGYNGFGELTEALDAQGRTSKLVYDPLGRRTRREDKASLTSQAKVTRWTWDTAGLDSSGELAKGALAQVDSPDGPTIGYLYDRIGRLRSTVRSIGSEWFSTWLTYDPLGRVATIDYPNAKGLSDFTVKNEYDAYGHLTKVWDPNNKSQGSVYYWQIADTDSADRITAESFGNGFTTARTYFDDKGSLKSIQTAKGAEAPVQDLAYEYDAKLNLLSRHDALQPQNTTEFFQYDALDRLTCSSFSKASTCPTADSYTYAPNGNLLTKPEIAGAYAYDPTHPHAVQTAGADAFTYDPVGNQITRSGTTVTYTAFDMPKAFTPAPGQGAAPVTLDYDGDQQRVRKTAGDEVTVYVDGLYERTTNTKTSAVEHRYFVHGSERVVAVVTRSSAPTSEEKTRYLHVDNLGSVETVTDQTGSKSAEKRSYDAFGARRNPSWGAAPVAFSSLTTRGFTGHEDDEELGLVNMKGRLYDPKVGRFLTTDPIISHPGFGQSWNPYSYVLNNPLAHTDPSGFETTDTTYSNGTRDVVFDPVPLLVRPPIGPPPPPPPTVGASQAGLPTVPVDMGATGNKAASTPQPPPDGGNGCGGAGQNLALSAGGGGADSGALTQAALHPADYLAFRQNASEQAREVVVMAALARVPYTLVVGAITFGLFNPDPAYAPTPQTVPEDRPSVLEQAGQVGLAVAIGAIGIKLGQVEAASEGTSAVDRGGKAFTRSGRQAVKDANRAANGGTTVCENCGVQTVPGQRSVRGVSPPSNETNVDHVIPKARGGRGDPLNGQVLCRECNLKKSDTMP
jgi:RHS repeat-associated protein